MPERMLPRPGHRELRFFGVLRESPALHLYLLQAVAFAYLAYRFASRDYTVYGLLPDDAFDFPRTYLNELLPVPGLWLTTGQFVYAVLPHPGPAVLYGIQVAVIACSLLGLCGVLPRWNAWIAFLLATHVTGLVQSSNADVDGGSLVLCAVLILALAPAGALYSWHQGFHPLRRSVGNHWPLFLLLLVTGAFYSASGLNKLIEIGLDWPWTVHLENLASTGIEQSLQACGRVRTPALAAHVTPGLSFLGGWVTLAGEAGFLSVLWLPRFRPFFVVTMVALHALVYLLQGINFLGSSCILLLCLDWNVLARRATVLYDQDCGLCVRTMRVLARLDVFRRLDLVPLLEADGRADPGLLRQAMGLVDENGEVYYGADAFEQAGARVPLLWPYALLMKVPGLIYPARAVYAVVARRRSPACRLGAGDPGPGGGR
jgi:predicted DCC family thiol-disulfide oxidoreductase YuxK